MSTDADPVFDRLARLLEDDFQVPPTAIAREAHLRTDLGLDSLSLTDLAFLVQQDFQFKAPPEDFRGITTLGSLSDFVSARATS